MRGVHNMLEPDNIMAGVCVTLYVVILCIIFVQMPDYSNVYPYAHHGFFIGH